MRDETPRIDDVSRHLMEDWYHHVTPGCVQHYMVVDMRRYLDHNTISAFMACRAKSMAEAMELIQNEWPMLKDNHFVLVFPVLNALPTASHVIAGLPQKRLFEVASTVYSLVIQGLKPSEDEAA